MAKRKWEQSKILWIGLVLIGIVVVVLVLQNQRLLQASLVFSTASPSPDDYSISSALNIDDLEATPTADEIIAVYESEADAVLELYDDFVTDAVEPSDLVQPSPDDFQASIDTIFCSCACTSGTGATCSHAYGEGAAFVFSSCKIYTPVQVFPYTKSCGNLNGRRACLGFEKENILPTRGRLANCQRLTI